MICSFTEKKQIAETTTFIRIYIMFVFLYF